MAPVRSVLMVSGKPLLKGKDPNSLSPPGMASFDADTRGAGPFRLVKLTAFGFLSPERGR